MFQHKIDESQQLGTRFLVKGELAASHVRCHHDKVVGECRGCRVGGEQGGRQTCVFAKWIHQGRSVLIVDSGAVQNHQQWQLLLCLIGCGSWGIVKDSLVRLGILDNL